MKWIYLLFMICCLLSCNTTLIAQYKLFERFDVDNCRYKVDTLYNSTIVGSSFFDCTGKTIKVYQKGVDSLPQRILEDKEWNALLKNEVSKITQMDINVFIIYGIVINSEGTILNIEKLSKIDYEDKVEERIVSLLKSLKWKPAKVGNQKVNFYLTFPIKVNLM